MSEVFVCKCGGYLSRVVDSRLAAGQAKVGIVALRRRRACPSCGDRLLTYEVSADFVKEYSDKIKELQGRIAEYQAAANLLLRGSKP